MATKHPHHPPASSYAQAQTLAPSIPAPPPIGDASGIGFFWWVGIVIGGYFALRLGFIIFSAYRQTINEERHRAFRWFLARNQAQAWLGYTGDHSHRRAELGDARLAYQSEIAQAGGFADYGIPLGQSINRAGKDPFHLCSWIRYDKQAHVIMIAAARTGKFRDIQAPVLLNPLEQGCFVLIDTKGQASTVSYAASNTGYNSAVYINPYDQFADRLGPSTAYNPMWSLNPLSRGYGSDCLGLADACVWTTGNDREDFFNSAAADIIAAGIYYYRKYGAPCDQNLVAVREMVTTPAIFTQRIKDALATGDAFLTERLAQYEGITEERKSLQDVLATARNQTAFIGADEAMRQSLRGDPAKPFDFRSLRQGKGRRVFLILDGDKLKTGGKWFRLVIASAIRELMQNIEGEQVTMILDEASAMGKLAILETMMGLGAGYKSACGQSSKTLISSKFTEILGRLFSLTLVCRCGLHRETIRLPITWRSNAARLLLSLKARRNLLVRA